MKPANLMCLGMAVSIVGVASAIIFDTAGATVLCFAGGAVFGEGYGVSNERYRQATAALARSLSEEKADG